MAREFPVDQATQARFWSHTRREGDCIIWTGSSNRGGYGQFNAGRLADGRKGILLAHRYAWILAHGANPVGKCLCHRCDVRLCVNVEHLFVGTHADNNRDMFAKGRGYVFDGSHILGERHTQAKLSEADVREIRRLRSGGLTLSQIGQQFGVTKNNVHLIVSGKAWAHVE